MFKDKDLPHRQTPTYQPHLALNNPAGWAMATDPSLYTCLQIPGQVSAANRCILSGI